MQAFIFDGTTRLANIPAPQLVPGEAIIAPRLAGICATDVHITRGYMHYHGVLGHEFVGTVVECDEPGWIGQRVVGEINACCHHCPTCARGDEPHCPNRTTLGIDRRDGTMAERFRLPLANLHRVPAALTDEVAVFIEPLAAALEIVDRSHVRPTERIAVVGDGKLGLLVAQVLRLTGAELVVVGHHPERWELLQAQGIATNGDPQALAARDWDVVVDCTGSPAGLEAARRLVRPRGRLVLKSTFHGTSPLDLSLLVVDEIALIGSRCGPFAPALRLLERGLVETTPLIHAIYPLAEAEQAFGAAQGQVKVLLRMSSGS
ncbi:MAG: alcohol dehydrogenase catalytic domain-containing protein [Herpetosiphonaceae bacterium]|nr:alcohol dehydrogenase catalytic domain-containing protein [Herpetosiphonaceae bacterium]